MKYLFLLLISFNCFSQMTDTQLKDCINFYEVSPSGISLGNCVKSEIKAEVDLEFKCKVIQSVVRLRNKRQGLTGAAKLQFLNKIKDIAAAINSCSLDSAKILAAQIVVDAVITQEDKTALIGFLE